MLTLQGKGWGGGRRNFRKMLKEWKKIRLDKDSVLKIT